VCVICVPNSGQEVFLWPVNQGNSFRADRANGSGRVGPLDSDKQGVTGYAGDVDEVDFGRRQTERSLAPLAAFLAGTFQSPDGLGELSWLLVVAATRPVRRVTYCVGGGGRGRTYIQGEDNDRWPIATSPRRKRLALHCF
jgi:hypothetical protein